MLIAVRAEVESVDHWREQFKTHDELFRSQGVTLAHMGAAEDNKVLAVFETNNPDEFLRIFNDPSTAEMTFKISIGDTSEYRLLPLLI